MFIEIKNARKHYGEGDALVKALDDINLSLDEGKVYVILGPSGSGKSTLLNMVGGLDSLDDGEIIISGRNISRADKKSMTEYRREDIGFVFQFYNLVQNLTALENVELASQISKDPLNSLDILERVGLGGRKDNFPAQLSGGEQQRVAIARAIAKNPKLLLCDEPTGALDYQTGKSILGLLRSMCDNYGMTVIVITHNSALAPMADQVIHLKNGKVEKQEYNEHPESIDNIEW